VIPDAEALIGAPSAADTLRDVHRVAAAQGLTVTIVDMGVPDPVLVAAGRMAPYRFRMEIMGPRGLMFGSAREHAGDLPAVVRDAWAWFVGWGWDQDPA
jgi:hypothetical protein